MNTKKSKFWLEQPLECKNIQPVCPKGNQFWIVIGRTDAEAETPILWPPDVMNLFIGKDPERLGGKDWERLKAGGEGDDRGWYGWMASLTQWTWVWASSGCWWWTGKLDVLQFMGLQRVRHNWVTELNWTECRRHRRHGFDPLVGKIPWRRPWQPTPVFLPGESHGQGNLVGYSP